MAIRAPYNFVPLSGKVFFPDWADQISQDVPFEDGVSGTIELKITAQTPIFVRNGHTKFDAEANDGLGNEEYKSPSNINGQFFIPGTTIKGCIRNVLEILSFGKMRLDKNAKFAQREWDNGELYPMKKEQGNVHCGWLKPNGDNYVLLDCGTPMRIAMDKIDDYIGIHVFDSHFSKDNGINLNQEDEIDNKKYDPKTAVYKYKLLENYCLTNLSFDYDEEYCSKHKDNRLKVVDDGAFHGTIVLTGQPDKYMYPRPKTLTKGAGKFYEFVFRNEVLQKYNITAEDFNHYKFIYSDSPDWEYAQSRLDKEGIPVFFRIEKNAVKDWGLAFLYKLPYNNTPYETLTDKHKSNDCDMSDCIFGYTQGEKSLRGRVQFGNAFSTNAETSDSIRLSLGSPKASYYPIYIRQDGRSGKVTSYKTYNDGEISGWKRYVVRKEYFHHDTGNDKIDTIIRPLNIGSIFSCIVHFHNLKKKELGALLSAITFHNSEDCYHQIGQGKPYGFGKVKISVETLIVDNEKKEVNEYLVDFEELMYEKYNKSWVNDDRVSQLMTLAHEEVTENDVFNYLVMSTNGPNEFVAAKVAKEYLRTYSELSSCKYTPISLYEPIRAIRKEKQEKEKEQIVQDNIAGKKANVESYLQQKDIDKAKKANDDLRKYLNENNKETAICDEYEKKISELERENSPISSVINSLKLGTVKNMVKKWMDAKGMSTLDDTDKSEARMKLKRIYEGASNKDKKGFDNSRQSFEDLFGSLDF